MSGVTPTGVAFPVSADGRRSMARRSGGTLLVPVAGDEPVRPCP